MRGRDGDMAETGSVHATRFEAAVKVIQSLPKNGKCGLWGESPVASVRGLAARLAPARRAGQGRRRGPPGGSCQGSRAALPQPPRARRPSVGGGWRSAWKSRY